jgi:hypothetical protein
MLRPQHFRQNNCIKKRTDRETNKTTTRLQEIIARWGLEWTIPGNHGLCEAASGATLGRVISRRGHGACRAPRMGQVTMGNSGRAEYHPRLLIVAEDEDTDPAGFAFAPLLIGGELQARFGAITDVL